MMSLLHVSRRVASHNPCLRSSYAEISRFVRSRRHGTTLRSAICSQNAVRCFTSPRMLQDSAQKEIEDARLERETVQSDNTIEPDSEASHSDTLRQALDKYKKTCNNPLTINLVSS